MLALMPVAGATDEALERERELALLDGLLDRCDDRAGAVFVADGPAGIGKTELLAAAARLARSRGFLVLRARGSEFEAGMPFGVARQLLEPMLRSAANGERRRLLDGVARVGARALGLEGGEPPADPFAATHGLYWLCANRADLGPMLLVVDDLQWVDDPSLAWLGYLGRRAGDLRLLLALGLRSGEPGGERPELEALVGDPAARRVALGPLSEAGVSQIVRARLDADADQQFCAACSELTGGNPLFVRELLESASGEALPARAQSLAALRLIAPSAIGTSVLARLGRIGSEAIALARAVAVLGPRTDVTVAAALAELELVRAELTADRLAAAQIFAPARPLEFFHPLIAAAVREDLAPGARRVAHRRAAELAAGAGEPPARVAAHLLACMPAGDNWAVEQLRAAARDALEQGAPESAANYPRRALMEPPAPAARAETLAALGTAAFRAAQADATAIMEQAIAAAGQDQGTFLAASIQLAQAYVVSELGADRAVEVLDRARDAAGEVNTKLALTLESAAALVGILNDQTAPEAFRRADALRDRLDAIADPPVHLLVLLANCAARVGDESQARALAERALASNPYPLPTEVALALITPLTLVEAYDLQQHLCDDMLALGRHRGAIQEMVGVYALRAVAAANRGALADAEADARWALERSAGMYRLQAVSELIRVLIERDELDQAERELEYGTDPSESRSVGAVRYLLARGRLRAAQGRPEEALEDLNECGQRSERLRLLTIAGTAWRCEAALVHESLGRHTEARRLAREQLERVQAFGPRTLGISLRACGLLEGGTDGLRMLGEAVSALERAQAPLELARALTDHGAALRRTGRRQAARGALERALDLAHHCGARRIAAVARAELVAAGAKPRRDAITGRDALTAGELRVAKLAADGLSNREIAQTLFISTKTASTHLSHVYRKLDITRRGQLGQALAGRVDDSAKREGTTSVAPAQSIS
jgi:DNA-binding CsgD family transcriptional regulator